MSAPKTINTTSHNSPKPISHLDPAITTLRTIAMFLIVVTHLASCYGMDRLMHIANIGTPIFFILSGYLYGQKSITNWNSFYVRRLKTLMVPIYIWVMIVGIISALCFSTYYSVWQYATHFFNLAGSWFIAPTAKGLLSDIVTLGHHVKAIEGLNQLWFMTFLMICHLLIPLLQSIKNYYSNSKFWYRGWTPILVMYLLSVLAAYCRMDTWYIGVFMIGYFVNRNMVPYNRKGCFFLIFLIMMGVVHMLFGSRMLNQTLYEYFYDVFHYKLAQTFIVFGILGLTQFFFQRFPNMMKIPNVGSFTYCVYITHFIFLHGVFQVVNPSSGHAVCDIISFLLLTILSAILLQVLTWLVMRLKWIPYRVLKKSIYE